MKRATGLMLGILAGLAVIFLSLGPGSASSGPELAAPTTISSDVTYPDMNVVLEPVPDGYHPKITSDEAVAIAEKRHPDFAQAKSISPVLALYTNNGVVDIKSDVKLIDQVPAWVVEIDGLCAVMMGDFTPEGQSPAEQVCLLQDRHVVVNADTGEMVEDWGQ
jgi:hypothetical protein